MKYTDFIVSSLFLSLSIFIILLIRKTKDIIGNGSPKSLIHFIGSSGLKSRNTIFGFRDLPQNNYLRTFFIHVRVCRLISDKQDFL